MDGWLYNVIVNVTKYGVDGLRGMTSAQTEQVRLTAYDERDAKITELAARSILTRLGATFEIYKFKEPVVLKEEKEADA